MFNPALYGSEECWGKIYFADEILEVIERNGYQPYIDCDFKRGIYPKDKNINDQLKYIEAHVWRIKSWINTALFGKTEVSNCEE